MRRVAVSVLRLTACQKKGGQVRVRGVGAAHSVSAEGRGLLVQRAVRLTPAHARLSAVILQVF